ncbi:GP46-like surface antigen, putative [Bodo saltans]|uniref:GP46-like surface antigen, putative n=1 Tax=Bodo saltans TaxID=75058 RepID=A0A0S4IHU9_BODSA|nr:GP46-like surface antigen, putative [Bodo saltans]|eukprot:CUE69239.1 GP46-like surface antigen, putative [Bodo saltans]
MCNLRQTVCSATSPTQQREGSVLLLALSPFSPLGSAWATTGNSLLCCVLVGLHVLVIRTLWVARCRSKTSGRKIRQLQSLHATTLLGRWLGDDGDAVPNKQTRRHVLARLRFPNASVAMVLLVVPGVVRGAIDVVVMPSTDGGTLSTREKVALGVGVVFVTLAVCVVEFGVYRHVNAEVSLSLSFSVASPHRNAAHPRSSHSCCLRYVCHQCPAKLFRPVPSVLSHIALPKGSWESAAARTAYGGVVSVFDVRWRRAWVVLPSANIVIQVLSGVDGGSAGGCDAVQSVTLLVLRGVCAFMAYARPHRALLASYLVCASLVLTMVTALLGLLCRHGAVSSDAVSGFGVFASVAMFVFKLYHVLMPIIERWLLGRGSNVVRAATGKSNRDSPSNLFHLRQSLLVTDHKEVS